MTNHKEGDRVYYRNTAESGTLEGWAIIKKIDGGWATLVFENSGKEGGGQVRHLLTESEAIAEGVV